MTREQADKILGYIVENILSPLALDERPAKDAWLELTSEPFNTLVAMVNECVDDDNIKDYLKVISFETCMHSSSGQKITGTEREHNLLFNTKSISPEQVNYLIEMDMYEYDSRVIDVTNEQLKYLRAKKEEAAANK